MTAPDELFRILAATDWTDAKALGQYRGGAHDIRDGYLHLSTRHQVAGTLAKHYAGQRDLLILVIDPSKLSAPLRYEPSRGGELFPHLYGPLPIEAVTQILKASDWPEVDPAS